MLKILFTLTEALCFPLLTIGQGAAEILRAPSSVAPEFASTSNPNGSLLLFNRSNASRSKMWIMAQGKSNGKWGSAYVPSFTDSTYREIDPIFSPDGQTVFFSSNRPRAKGGPAKDFDLWMSRRQGAGWGPAQWVPGEVNSTDDEIFCSQARNGNLYFARFPDQGKTQVFCAKWRDGAFQKPERVVMLHDSIGMANPAISPDERWLLFTSPDFPGYGSADIMLAEKLPDGNWSAPRNLGSAVNSPFADFAPAFSPDGQWIYFTSERPGVVQDYPAGQRRPGDLYRINFPLLQKSPEFIIRQNILDFSRKVVAADWAGVAAAYTEDAKIFPPGTPIISQRDAIQRYWTPPGDAKSKTVFHRVQPEAIELKPGLAIDWGYYFGKSQDEKGETRDWKGKYVIVWKETRPGEWKIFLDSWNRVDPPK
jgi:ketosteroid isomerase-like protein/Tol biopolymer transport system component